MMIPIDVIKSHMEKLKGSPVEVNIPSMTGRQFRCNCPNPNHPDHTPSCYGDLETGEYYCFGCNTHGTVEPVKV